MASQMTWIKDFIINNFLHNQDENEFKTIWEFFERNVHIRETHDAKSRVRSPYVKAYGGRIGNNQKGKATHKEQPTESLDVASWKTSGIHLHEDNMISLVRRKAKLVDDSPTVALEIRGQCVYEQLIAGPATPTDSRLALLEMIVTAIPFRQNASLADDLIETIQQGNYLDTMQSSNDLLKHIVFETVTFPDQFRWAGLGEHVLDIFEAEIARQTDQEARYFKEFSSVDKGSKLVNDKIHEAAKAIWEAKDIRDELRLLLQLFQEQSRVISQLAEIFWPTSAAEQSNNAKDLGKEWKELRESFIRDCGLDNLIRRVKKMDNDASTTSDGLANVIQAMQAQASLREAEEARNLNMVILPFTIVTVIFTPLSFLTSLFAVNTDAFPQNADGELRLPASWFIWRMVVGEICVLVPLVFLLWGIHKRKTMQHKLKETPEPEPVK
ncbi:hypothetical protein N3K66_000188 [Trichothecium roseum]|uniref:Uncharacterized protein n=1 Tax=Trichothecium roseum TaxID=47278 RepID=A0ACC0VBT5_9HYPO|nr:hypothetical protein N3K66_000188 [Trichothecium roseum]